MYGFICKEKWEADKICLPKDLELVEEVVDYFFCQAVHGCCVIIPVKTEVTVGGFGDLDAVQSVERQVIVVQTELVHKYLFVNLHLAANLCGRPLGYNLFIRISACIASAYLLPVHGVADDIQIHQDRVSVFLGRVVMKVYARLQQHRVKDIGGVGDICDIGVGGVEVPASSGVRNPEQFFPPIGRGFQLVRNHAIHLNLRMRQQIGVREVHAKPQIAAGNMLVVHIEPLHIGVVVVIPAGSFQFFQCIPNRLNKFCQISVGIVLIVLHGNRLRGLRRAGDAQPDELAGAPDHLLCQCEKVISVIFQLAFIC